MLLRLMQKTLPAVQHPMRFETQENTNKELQMGLDFSHCDAHWSYSGFHRFRFRLAERIGIKLDDMVDFGGTTSWDLVKDPLRAFFNHSDCDGSLTPQECSAIAPRIEEEVAPWDNDDYDKKQALLLVAGMRAAAKHNETLLFH
jgi:hypothetical protein